MNPQGPDPCDMKNVKVVTRSERQYIICHPTCPRVPLSSCSFVLLVSGLPLKRDPSCLSPDRGVDSFFCHWLFMSLFFKPCLIVYRRLDPPYASPADSKGGGSLGGPFLPFFVSHDGSGRQRRGLHKIQAVTGSALPTWSFSPEQRVKI